LQVSAGSVVVEGGGGIVVKAVRVGRDTTLALILERVQSAHMNMDASSSSTVALVDRLAALLVHPPYLLPSWYMHHTMYMVYVDTLLPTLISHDLYYLTIYVTCAIYIAHVGH